MLGKYYKSVNIPFDGSKSLVELVSEVKSMGKLEDMIAFTNKEMLAKPFPGAIAPAETIRNVTNGQASSGKLYYHFDGHHRSRAIVELNQAINSVSPETTLKIRPAVTVLADLEKASVSETIAKFKEIQKGYILPAENRLIMSGAGDKDLAKFKIWSRNIEQIPDYPARSLAGTLLFQNNINSSKYVDYVEFLFLEDLPPEFTNMKPGTLITPEMVAQAEKTFFSDPRKVEKFAKYARDNNLVLKVQTEIEVLHFEMRNKYNLTAVPLSKEQDAIHEIIRISKELDICQ
jgi:hypothetical protein